MDADGNALAGAVFGEYSLKLMVSHQLPTLMEKDKRLLLPDGMVFVTFIGFEAKRLCYQGIEQPQLAISDERSITVTVEDYVKSTNFVVDKGNVVNTKTPPTPPTTPSTPPTPSTDKPRNHPLLVNNQKKVNKSYFYW